MRHEALREKLDPKNIRRPKSDAAAVLANVISARATANSIGDKRGDRD